MSLPIIPRRKNGSPATGIRKPCWMSWNAAKRAVALGYTGVNWFPEGSDGWVAAGGDLVTAEPAQ